MNPDIKATLIAAKRAARGNRELTIAVKLAMGTAAAARKYPHSKPVQNLLREHVAIVLAMMKPRAL